MMNNQCTTLFTSNSAEDRSFDDQVLDGEFTIQTRSDETRIWDFSFAALGKSSDGRRLVANTAIDMTECKYVQDALQESEARLRLVLEAGRLGIWEWNLLTAELICEPQCEKLFGLKPGSFEGTYEAFKRLVHPDDLELVTSSLQEAMQLGEWEIDYRIIHPDTSIHWITVTGRVIYNQDGQAVQMIGIVKDITQHKRTEAELQQAKETRLQVAFEGSGDGLWDWNITTGEVYYSPRWFEMLGYEVDQFSEDISSWEQLIHPEDKPWVMDKLNTHLQDSSFPFTFDYRILTQSGEWKWIANYGKVVVRDENGNPLRMAGTHRDITARKHTEEKLKLLNVQLEESNQELQNFAFVASHDLKEPLRTILGFNSLLQNRYEQLLDERGRDYIRRMQNSAQRMQNLIDNLLTLSRVTTQAKPFVYVDLNQTVQNVLSSLEKRIQETKAQVEIGELPTIEADSGQLHQLLQNLISNALKFHGENSPVVKIYSNSVLNSVCQIFVEDQGIGFDEKYLDRIFKIFERLHGRSEYEGTGIGLALCRKIAERHGGSITAKSLPGLGSTFIVTLPIEGVKTI